MGIEQVKDIYDVQDLLGSADETRNTNVVEVIQDHLLTLIHTTVDLEDGFKFLNPAEQKVLLTSVIERTELLQDADDLLAVLGYFQRSARTEFLQAIPAERLLAMVKDAAGLAQLEDIIAPAYYQVLVTQQEDSQQNLLGLR